MPDPSRAFTFESQGRASGSPDVILDHGRLVLVAESADGCRVVPDTVTRLAAGDLRVQFRTTTDCDPAMRGTKLRITLDDGPITSPVAVFRDDETTGVLLLRGSEIPRVRPGGEDCGVDLVCFAAALEAGRPAFLGHIDASSASGPADYYEVLGPHLARVTTISTSDVGPPHGTVARCQRVDVGRDTIVRRDC